MNTPHERESGESTPSRSHPWIPLTPREVAERLRTVEVTWAMAGGWALDLFLGTQTRAHEDTEIVIAREQFAQIEGALPDLDWYAVGNGEIWPLAEAPGGLHQTWGWDRSARCWRLDVMREPWDDGTWVYRRNEAIRRPLAEAIEHSDDATPYLAPEIVLLFKAKDPRAKDDDDFTRALPKLDRNRRHWLAAALQSVSPNHRWLRSLAPALS